MTKTLKEVAQELNTSVSTISRVVNNKKNVNEATRKRVLEALKHSDYTPNQVARSLKIKSTMTIGIVVPDVCERFFGQIIKGVDAIVSKHGFSIILVDTNESREKEEQYLEMLFQQRVDALVIATVDTNGTKILQFMKHNIPVVFIDNLPNIEVPYDAVLIDNILASKIAVRRFIEEGHKRIAAIIGSPQETTGYDRLLGYRLALQDAGLEVDERLIEYGNYKEDSGYACMERLIENRKNAPFTAVYVTSELMTIGALKSFKDHGIKFPDDIALIGFDFHDKTGLLTPGITTMRQPEKEIGELTAELLLKRLAAKGVQRGKQLKKPPYEAGQRTLLIPYLDVKQSG
jgi:LacI family transcriptional regulator